MAADFPKHSSFEKSLIEAKDSDSELEARDVFNELMSGVGVLPGLEYSKQFFDAQEKALNLNEDAFPTLDKLFHADNNQLFFKTRNLWEYILKKNATEKSILILIENQVYSKSFDILNKLKVEDPNSSIFVKTKEAIIDRLNKITPYNYPGELFGLLYLCDSSAVGLFRGHFLYKFANSIQWYPEIRDEKEPIIRLYEEETKKTPKAYFHTPDDVTLSRNSKQQVAVSFLDLPEQLVVDRIRRFCREDPVTIPQNWADYKKQCEYDDVTESAVMLANSYCKSLTALPVVRLMLYNELKESGHVSKSLLLKIKDLTEDEEKLSSAGNLLPTIGIEIEIPGKCFPQSGHAKKILTFCGIHNEPVPSIRGKNSQSLHEVNPSFNYSAKTSTRLIAELKNILDLSLIDQSEDIVSLHVNLGIPTDLPRDLGVNEKLDFFSLIFGLAFASEARLKNRKTINAYAWWRNADKTNKTKNAIADPAFEYDEDRVGEDGYSVFHISGKSLVGRLEVKLLEFKDETSYRMLYEIQRLSACLFQYLRKIQSLPMSSQGSLLAKEFEIFYSESNDVLSGINASLLTKFINKDPSAVFPNEIVGSLRSKITKTSRKVSTIVN